MLYRPAKRPPRASAARRVFSYAIAPAGRLAAILLPLLGLAGIVPALAGLLALGGCDRGPDPAAPVRQVLLVGVEGLSLERVTELVDRGELPHLGRLWREGARAELTAPDPLLAPMLWTTVLTGKMPRHHEVTGDLVNLPSGKRTLVPSSMRATRNLLQIASKENVPVVSVGMPATWPAEVVHGFLVAPGAVPERWTRTAEHTYRRDPSLMATYPPELYEEIRPLLRDFDSLRREEVSRFFVLNETEYSMLYDQPLGSIFKLENPLRDFGLTYLRDSSYVDVALYLIENYEPRLSVVHLQLLDALQPTYWAFSEPDVYDTPRDSQRRFRDTVDEAYRWLDEQIGRLMEALPPGSVICVTGDKGFHDGADNRADPSTASKPVPLASNRTLLLLSGPPVAKGVDAGRGSLADVTPTILRLLDLPVGADMDGRVLEKVLRPQWLTAHPERVVETHDADWNPQTRYPRTEAPDSTTPDPSSPETDEAPR